MTTPYTRALPPLRGLPSPPRVPSAAPHLVPPAEILAESKRAITRRLLAIFWVPALILLALWYTLLTLYVVGASPTFWGLSLLVTLVEPGLFTQSMTSLGFSSRGLWLAYLFIPLLATATSVPLIPVATRAIAGLNPRLFLSERAFQESVSSRITAVFLAPAVLVVAALPVAVVLGMPMPWSGLGAGQLMALCLGLGAIMLAWVSVRRSVTAARVLGVAPWQQVRATAQLEPDQERRRAAAKLVLAQDRRHLPPNPGSPESAGAFTPRGMLTALAATARASLLWVWPAAVVLGWVIFGIADFALVIAGIASEDLTQVPSALRWPVAAIGAPVLLLVLFAVALAPGLAALCARSLRGQVRDQRTYAEWAHRSRVNPWEARVVALTGVFTGCVVALGAMVLGGALSLVQAGTAVSTVALWTVVLVLAPLSGAAAAAAMRSGLRDVFYGPAGWYMQRESPYALVAPEIGTRAERAKDPAVRAELRRRLQEQAGDHSLQIFDLDRAEERLWVDESLPGATDTAVRAADVAAGNLPDFGAESSPFVGDASTPGRDATGGNPNAEPIPDSITGLRER